MMTQSKWWRRIDARWPMVAFALVCGRVGAQSNSAESPLVRVDFGSVEVLSSLLDSPDVAVRTKAVATLASRGTPATIAPLTRALSDREPPNCKVAAEALGKLGDRSVVPAMAAALEDADAGCRMAIIRVLAQFGDPTASDAIAKSLGHSDSSVRKEAAEALGKLMATQHAAAVVPLLGDLDPRTQEAARRSIRAFGAVALPPLGAALGGKEKALRDGAGSLLVQFGTNAFPVLLQALREPEARPVAATALESLREPLGRLLVDGLAGRAGAMEAFVATRHPLVPELLLLATTDSDLTARTSAVAGLGRIPGPAIRARLFELLGDPLPAIRAAAVRSMGGLAATETSGQAELVGALLGAARDKESAVRLAAGQTIASLGRRPDFLQALAALAGGSDFGMRRLALKQLVHTEGYESSTYLRACRTVLLSPASLTLAGGILAIGALLAAGCVYGLTPTWVPGHAGWVALAGLWIALTLHFPAIAATRGSAVFLGMALLPGILALAAGALVGGAFWWLARQHIKESVCRHHYVRFVPGPNLGWMERGTGRLWVRHRGRRAGVDAMVADAVCCDHDCPLHFDGLKGAGRNARASVRVQGSALHFEEVKRVVAVLDNGAAWGPSLMTDGMLRVNWIEYRKTFDFEVVEIESASIADVQEFVRQIRFESPERLRQALPRMECLVGPRAHLDEATLRLLTPVFGKVTLKGHA